MLLSLTSTTTDATDLGFVLHKHPERVRSVDVGFGRAHVWYPEATTERCTATLFVEVDPVALSRKPGGTRKSGGAATLEPYVNDRPYAASSMLSVALGRLFGSALAGNCASRPELVDRALTLEIELPVVPVRGGEAVVRRLFEPLGWAVDCHALPLDEAFPRWGASRYVSVTLAGDHTVQRALQHLFVLLPVLDDKKHYWIGDDEVDKLLRRGGDWLPTHPEAEFITRRYLRFGGLAREALVRLAEANEDSDERDESNDAAEAEVERPLSLNDARTEAVLTAVTDAGGGRVVDLGCGEGRLLARLVATPTVAEVTGVDVSVRALERAAKRLRVDDMSERRRESANLIQGALTYDDARLRGFDVATVVEVVEHIDLERLDTFEQVLFERVAPPTIVLTTPNREYNVHFERLRADKGDADKGDGDKGGADRGGAHDLRHGDHRFEWTRAEFAAWVAGVTDRRGYRATISGIGPEDPDTGPPTQMAVFTRGIDR